MTGEWRKLHNEELNGLYSSPNIVLVIKSISMRWARHVARRGERRSVYRVLVGKLEGKDRFGDPCVCEWDLLSCIEGLGCGGMDWMQLAQDRGGWRTLVKAVMNRLVP